VVFHGCGDALSSPEIVPGPEFDSLASLNKDHDGVAIGQGRDRYFLPSLNLKNDG
jgi:hypothetical protein